jgi:RNA polymerase sigma-70 factor (ECF subfamily)
MRVQLGDDLERLVAECQGGDGLDRETAWKRLLEAVRQLALDAGRWTYHLGPEDCEDVAQVVQLRVVERLSQLRQPAAFPLWVRRVVHHAALDSLRQRRPQFSLDALPAPEAEAIAVSDEDDPYDQILLRADLDRALSRLPDLYQEPIRLHVLLGIPQDEVGRRLGRPRSTVATQIERGLGRLRRSLSGLALAS